MTKTRMLHLAAAAGLTGSIFAVAGCQTNETSLNAILAPEPPDVAVFADTTQPVRDYPRSVSYIQNGDTVAESTGARWRSADNVNVLAAPAVETGVFIGNLVTMPYTLIQQRGTIISTGLQFPPTYTAMPPLPPEQPAAQEKARAEPTMDVATTEPATQPVAAEVLERTTTQPGVPAFTITGQVLRPGTYDAGDNVKLSDVVAAAGPSTEDPKKVSIHIERRGEQPATTTLDQLQSGAVDDIVVKPGDVITIGVLP